MAGGGIISLALCPSVRSFVRRSVRSSFTKLVNAIFLKIINRFWCKLTQVVHAAMAWNRQLCGSWAHRSWSHEALRRHQSLSARVGPLAFLILYLWESEVQVKSLELLLKGSQWYASVFECVPQSVPCTWGSIGKQTRLSAWTTASRTEMLTPRNKNWNCRAKTTNKLITKPKHHWPRPLDQQHKALLATDKRNWLRKYNDLLVVTRDAHVFELRPLLDNYWFIYNIDSARPSVWTINSWHHGCQLLDII